MTYLSCTEAERRIRAMEDDPDNPLVEEALQHIEHCDECTSWFGSYLDRLTVQELTVLAFFAPTEECFKMLELVCDPVQNSTALAHLRSCLCMSCEHWRELHAS